MSKEITERKRERKEGREKEEKITNTDFQSGSSLLI